MCCKVLLFFIFCGHLDKPTTPLITVEKPGVQTLTISWTAQSDTTRPVRHYLIRLVLKSDEKEEEIISVAYNQTRYTFTDLLPGNNYNVSIAASNQVGISGYSHEIPFTTISTGE